MDLPEVTKLVSGRGWSRSNRYVCREEERLVLHCDSQSFSTLIAKLAQLCHCGARELSKEGLAS